MTHWLKLLIDSFCKIILLIVQQSWAKKSRTIRQLHSQYKTKKKLNPTWSNNQKRKHCISTSPTRNTSSRNKKKSSPSKKILSETSKSISSKSKRQSKLSKSSTKPAESPTIFSKIKKKPSSTSKSFCQNSQPNIQSDLFKSLYPIQSTNLSTTQDTQSSAPTQ